MTLQSVESSCIRDERGRYLGMVSTYSLVLKYDVGGMIHFDS